MSSLGTPAPAGSAAPSGRAIPSVMRRVAAIPYEGLLLLALVLIASFPIAGLKGLTLDGVAHLVFQLYLFAVVATFYTWQWQKTGQTLPMKTWHFRVVSSVGARLGWKRALLRFVCAMLFFGPACVGILLLFFPARLSPAVTIWFFLPLVANLLYAKFDQDAQFLHDRLAGTRLEDAPKPPSR